MGRPRKKDTKELVAAALVSALPALEPVDPNSLRGHESSIVRSGLAEVVCQYVFSGHSNVVIARKTGIGVDSLDRFLRTPYFQHLYASKKEMLLAAVDELSRERVQEILLQAIEKKYDIMMDERTSRGLADKIATDFIQMGERMLRTGKGRVSDALKAIFEQTMTQRGKNGEETKATIRLEGTPADVAAASRSVRGPDDAGTGGSGPRDDSESGARDGGTSVTEAPNLPAAPWDRRKDGGGGVQSVDATPGEPSSGPPASGVREGQ